MFWLGSFAFLLFFLSDLNDLTLRRRPLVFLFPAGAVMLVAACLLSLDMDSALIKSTPWSIGVWLAFVLFTGLEIHTLFFAFPAQDGYLRPGEKRSVCVSGVYALCRHPGVLWLTLMLLCLRLCAGLPLRFVIAYTLLNAALVLFEDIYVFPVRLAGYDDYKKTVPFLLPTPSSILCFIGAAGNKRK